MIKMGLHIFVEPNNKTKVDQYLVSHLAAHSLKFALRNYHINSNEEVNIKRDKEYLLQIAALPENTSEPLEVFLLT